MKKNKIDISKMSSKNLAFMGIIAILVILLFQSTASLFMVMKIEGLDQIDVVFRTSLSSIFGYLMSMASVGEFSIKGKKKTSVEAPKTIGFSANDQKETKYEPSMMSSEETSQGSDSKDFSIGLTNYDLNKKTTVINVQIVVLTIMCIFCLLIMIVVRNFSDIVVFNSSNTVTISMFRDIISGSVGALIGLSRANN